MRRDDETELDIGFADGSNHDAPADDRGVEDADLVASEPGDEEHAAGRRRWNSPLPWFGVGVALAVAGSVMAANVPPVLGDAPGMIAPATQPPSLQWQADTCAQDANVEIVGDAVLVLTPSCAQALDLATGEELWRVGDLVDARCDYAAGPFLACLTGPADRLEVVTIELATGERSERDADGASGVVAVQDGVVESSSEDENHLAIRRVAVDRTELWSRTIEVGPGVAGDVGMPFWITGPVIAFSSPAESRYLDLAEGSDVEVTWSDARADLVAVGPFDSDRAVLDRDGHPVASLLPGQMLPTVLDELEPQTVLVSTEPLDLVSNLQFTARDRSGTVLWDLPKGAYPVAQVGDVVLLFGTGMGGGAAVAHDLRTGAELWRMDGDVPWPFATDGTRLLANQFTEEGHSLVAIDAATGEEVWRVLTGERTSYGVYDVADDGSILTLALESVSVWRAGP